MIKNKKKLVIIGGAIVSVLCFVGGFCSGKWFAQKKEKVVKPKEETVEKVIFSHDKLQTMIDILPEKAYITNLEKDLTNNEKIDLAMNFERLVNNDSTTYDKGEALKKVLVKNFGSDLNIKLENLQCACGKDFYIYDSKNDVYKENNNHEGHGSMNAFGVDNHIENYEVIGNTISVKVSKIFYPDGGFLGPITGYYLSYEDAVKYGYNGDNEKTLPEGNSEEYHENGLDYFEEVRKLEKDALPVYTYTFEKTGDNFIFKGYELSK